MVLLLIIIILTTTTTTTTTAARTNDEIRALAQAQDRVRILYAEYENRKEMKLRQKDLELKPRKTVLAQRMSKSVRFGMK